MFKWATFREILVKVDLVKILVKVDLSNYATETDLKNITHIDTSNFKLKQI